MGVKGPRSVVNGKSGSIQIGHVPIQTPAGQEADLTDTGLASGFREISGSLSVPDVLLLGIPRSLFFTTRGANWFHLVSSCCVGKI